MTPLYIQLLTLKRRGSCKFRTRDEVKLEASEPERVNPNYIQYGVNSLRLGGLQLWYKNQARRSSVKTRRHFIMACCANFAFFELF